MREGRAACSDYKPLHGRGTGGFGAFAEVDIRTPAEMRKMISPDMAKWAKVVKDAGVRAE